jgi:hypothetical protein
MVQLQDKGKTVLLELRSGAAVGDKEQQVADY